MLIELAIFENLHAYQPILTGTLPIGIDLPKSDLDIICAVADHPAFAKTLTSLFAGQAGFSVRTAEGDGMISTIAIFHAGGFEIEIFGQDCPTREQHAYRHLLIEHKILQAQGEAFRAEIIRLKRSGLKTEPAFAQLLGLEGNPYEALLRIEWG